MKNESQNWRSLFKHYEDLLTAAFWGRISYLSEESLCSFLSTLLAVDASSWGAFESITFWPKYDFPDQIDKSVHRWVDDGSRFAEPDVVMNFAQATLLIEVKPPAGGQQYQQQWCKEIYAWQKSEGKNTELHFLALGNVPANAQALFAELESIFTGVIFHCQEWRSVREKLQYPERTWPTRQEQKIVADCLHALALYGIREPLKPWCAFLNFVSSSSLPDDFSYLKGKQ
ncbi:MAG TPA: hypothetical protein VH187_13275 [Scandinavium sp.]|jgi:hypothetical protein|nr:hypothetical protein [Scandinavium sp.]